MNDESKITISLDEYNKLKKIEAWKEKSQKPKGLTKDQRAEIGTRIRELWKNRPQSERDAINQKRRESAIKKFKLIDEVTGERIPRRFGGSEAEREAIAEKKRVAWSTKSKAELDRIVKLRNGKIKITWQNKTQEERDIIWRKRLASKRANLASKIALSEIKVELENYDSGIEA